MWHLTNIPQHAHFYWNTEFLPWARYLSLETFRKHNPDWKITLYRGTELTKYTAEQEGDTSELKNYWPEVEKLDVNIVTLDIDKIIGRDLTFISQPLLDVHRSDFVYMHLLSTVGGVWANMDILFFKPMEKAFFNVPRNNAYEVIGMEKNFNNFILSVPESDPMKVLLNMALGYSKKHILSGFATTGPSVYDKISGNVLRITLDTTEYRWQKTKYFREGLVPAFPNSVVGVHWHGGGRFGVYLSLTPENYKDEHTTFTDLIRRAIEPNVPLIPELALDVPTSASVDITWENILQTVSMLQNVGRRADIQRLITIVKDVPQGFWAWSALYHVVNQIGNLSLKETLIFKLDKMRDMDV